MSKIVSAAVDALNEKLDGGGIDGTVNFVIEDEGVVRVDENGASEAAEDSPADTTMTANAETFQSILAGDLDPTAAFMSGRLRIEGDIGLAMSLGRLLA